ncbi:citrulline utilization hydrolase CtlX [Mangrovicella endophytica]|uniref:citrulline utilization hydrolase CtlX n=1 Tax=Mangrovicella endophytica TaxID=2066697 RepID=UPI000C9DBFA4|nr:arginine deiminase-related protein [Mangrovicella endophytica]
MRGFAVQAPSSVVMIRPHHFTPNPETAADNVFQTADGLRTRGEIAEDAFDEVTRMAGRLREAGVTVHLFEDEGSATPDSVFPNNWFSTHAGGHVAIYPMFNVSRRRERRIDVIEMLKARYRVQDVIDYSGLERDNVFLEGTGAMVLDHIGRIAYAARSNRTNEVALERFCTHFNFEPMLFEAADAQGREIYHTNVIMCVGTDLALVGLDTIVDPLRRAEVRTRLEETGRVVVPLSHAQIAEFAGNALELQGHGGRLLAISSRALASLTEEQRRVIGAITPILPIAIPTIELAGGSVRCMLAGIHLAARASQPAASAA